MHLAEFSFLWSVLISYSFLIFQDLNLLEKNLPDILSNVSYSEFACCFLMIKLVLGILKEYNRDERSFSLRHIRGSMILIGYHT